MSTPGKDTDIGAPKVAQQTASLNTTAYSEWLQSVRVSALKRIQTLLSTLFDNIDDVLFDLGEKAGKDELQSQYFDSMREIRKRRPVVEQKFQDHHVKIFTAFTAGKLQPANPEVSRQPQQTGLSLVGEDDLEESLAVTTMVAKAEQHLAKHLFALNQRLSALTGNSKIEDSTNPIGPAHLCQAFRAAASEFEVTPQVKLIIYKLLDRYVMGGLEDLYAELNNQLSQAGVLPQIPHTLPGQSRVPSLSGGANSKLTLEHDSELDLSEKNAWQKQASGSGVRPSLSGDVYQALRSLLAHQRENQLESYSQANKELISSSYGTTDLLNALAVLQNQATMTQVSGSTGAATPVVQEIKSELLDQVSKLTGSASPVGLGADEDTIDLVGMLFEFILEDHNLPAQIQVLLARLQIPFLKAAILDKELFAQKTHPARQLLDVLAHACVGWSEESDQDNRLYEQVKHTVESLLREFDDDLRIFERLRIDFDTFIERNKKRAEIAEQRVAEATRGREKLQEARRNAAHEIMKCVEGRQLPPLFYDILSRPWANYLVLIQLRQGTKSDEWKNALKFTDEFVWSSQVKTSESDKLQLQNIMPLLEKNLRHGLVAIAYHEHDIDQLVGELKQCYERLLNGETLPSQEMGFGANEVESTDMASAPSTSPLPSPLEDIAMIGKHDPEIAEVNLAENDPHLQLAKGIKVGTWFEFTDPTTGVKNRAKLSWISPISEKYLFVNRKGLKLADKTVYALATELREGSAVILQEVSLFDRALDAIVQRLKSTQINNTDKNPGAA